MGRALKSEARPNKRVQRTRSSASPPHSPLTRRPLGAAVKSSRGGSASGRAARLGHEGTFGKAVVESRKSPLGSSRHAAALRCHQRRSSRGRGASASSQVRA